jgi:hypothetical protein
MNRLAQLVSGAAAKDTADGGPPIANRTTDGNLGVLRAPALDAHIRHALDRKDSTSARSPSPLIEPKPASASTRKNSAGRHLFGGKRTPFRQSIQLEGAALARQQHLGADAHTQVAGLRAVAVVILPKHRRPRSSVAGAHSPIHAPPGPFCCTLVTRCGEQRARRQK